MRLIADYTYVDSDGARLERDLARMDLVGLRDVGIVFRQ